MKKICVWCLIVISVLTGADNLYAQHEHHDHHHHGRNEIGLNTGTLYAIDDNKWGSGVHLHYFRSLGDHSRWAIGGFVEQTFFFDSHFSVGLGAKFRVIDNLYFSALPGLTFSKHSHDHHEGDGHDHETHNHESDKTKTKFSVHTELIYNVIRWKKFHMGPAIDYSWSKDDSHFMLGVHAAIDF